MVWTLVIEESNPVSDLDTEAPPVLVPPGERVVVFFFPLESGFGWPPGEPIQVYRTAHPSLLDAIRSLSRTGLDVGSYPATVLAASLICHEVPVNVAERNGFTAMMRAFGLGFPHLEESSKSEEPQLETSAAVVEVIIPLITSAAIRLVDEEATDIELSDPLGRPDDWLGEAFDMAVDHVRELQRQFAAVTRLPTRLLSRQQLPPMIVYGVRKFNALEPGEVSSGIFLVHNRLETLGPPLVLSEERQAAMLDVERSMHASAYLDLYNQADVALNLDGNLREAAVMIATASEVLLNRLILTMRWEEGTTPDILPGYWGVYTQPSDGNTYLGLITRGNGTWESIGQRLSGPLKKGSCYAWSLDLAHSDTYSGHNGPVKLRVWVSKVKCQKDQLIFESPVIEHTDWETYKVKFTANEDFQYILLEAFHSEEEFSYKGNILIDRLRAIQGCDRS